MFVLVHKEHHAFGACVERARAAIRGQGFSTIVEHDDATCRLLFAPRLTESELRNWAVDGPSFVLALGSFFYGEEAGLAATRAALRALGAGTFSADAASGNFALVHRRADAISITPDRLGTYPIYLSDDLSIASDSVIATAIVAGAKRLSVQAIYEYVFNCETLGDETLFEGISILPLGRRLDVAARRLVAMPDACRAVPFAADAETAFEQVAARLAADARRIVANFGDRISLALSGGYDTRLLLAMLRHAGATPDQLFVYGAVGDADVRVAKTVAEGEGIALRHADKGAAFSATPADYAAMVERNFVISDGCHWAGVFDHGVEYGERLWRAADGRIHVNGGGGEVLRNFFNLLDGRFSIRQFLHAFYYQFDPASCAAPFRERVYAERLAAKVKAVLGIERDRLERHEIEFLYPALRCRSFFTRDNSINNRVGPSLLPFFTAGLVDVASRIPLAAKHHGAFEARLIAHFDPKLARYPADYGHDFAGPPPLRRRLEDYGTYLRPTWLRARTFRIKNRIRSPARAPWLQRDYLAAVIDPDLPFARRYFHVERLTDAQQFARACSLEFLVARLGLEAGDAHA